MCNYKMVPAAASHSKTFYTVIYLNRSVEHTLHALWKLHAFQKRGASMHLKHGSSTKLLWSFHAFRKHTYCMISKVLVLVLLLLFIRTQRTYEKNPQTSDSTQKLNKEHASAVEKWKSVNASNHSKFTNYISIRKWYIINRLNSSIVLLIHKCATQVLLVFCMYHCCKQFTLLRTIVSRGRW